MRIGRKYCILATTQMGDSMVANVTEGRYIESDSNGTHYFSTSFCNKVGYNPQYGWKFVPLEGELWSKMPY